MAVFFAVIALAGLILLIFGILLDGVFDAVFNGLFPGTAWLSGPVVGAALAAFGGTGWLLQAQALLATIPAVGAGVVVATAGAWSTLRLSRTAMGMSTDAYEQYGEAAIIDLLAHMLPNVVREASAPISGIDKLTVISTDGASEITKSVANNVTQGVQLSSDLLGIDVATMLGRLSRGRTDPGDEAESN